MPDYSPPFAPHVRGSFPEVARDEDGAVEPLSVSLRCAACGEECASRCTSGRPRERVLLFAVAHLRCPGKVPT